MTRREPYADDRLLFYPGRQLNQEEKRRMEAYETKIDELTVDHMIFSMSRQIENNFQTFFRHQLAVDLDPKIEHPLGETARRLVLERRVDVAGPEVRRLDDMQIAVDNAGACLGHLVTSEPNSTPSRRPVAPPAGRDTNH
jgi:hypothetical protein